MFTSVPVEQGDETVEMYYGIRVGSDVSGKTAFTTNYSNMKVTPSDPYLWMNAAEVSFLMAEYELRWGDPTRAKDLYETAYVFHSRNAGQRVRKTISLTVKRNLQHTLTLSEPTA